MFRHFFKLLRNVKTATSTPFIAAAFINKDKLKPIELKESRNLTHGFLIQQASSVTVNAASQLLTQTVNAIVDTSLNYKNAMLELLGILEDSKSPNARYLEGELNDLLIEARSQVNDFKKELMELYSFMEYVEKVSESTAETAYLVGAEYVSTTLGERIHSAKVKLEETKRDLEQLEQELLNVQKDVILNDLDNK